METKIPTEGAVHRSIKRFRDATQSMMSTAKEEARRAEPLHGESVFVAYMDVLGFRKMVRRGHAELYRKYETVITNLRATVEMRSALGNIKKKSDGEYDLGELTIAGLIDLNPPIVFSDSIFIITRRKSPEALDQLCNLSNWLFHHFLASGLPVRGSISLGEVWWNPEKQIILGEGIVRTHDIAEALDCIGIGIDPNIEKPLLSTGPLLFALKDGGFLEMRVPLHGVTSGIGLLGVSGAEDFKTLYAQAISEGEPSVIKKYVASCQIVAAMGRNIDYEND